MWAYPAAHSRYPTMVNRLFCLLFLLIATSAFADDLVRGVQEELRRRNMYFGDVDGKMSPELSTALKRYQARKGFPDNRRD